jgi:hypothetical protein
VPADVLREPPSEEEMAAWLYPIVRGDEFIAEHTGNNGEDAAGLIAYSFFLIRTTHMQHKKSGYNPLGTENIQLQGSEPVIGVSAPSARSGGRQLVQCLGVGFSRRTVRGQWIDHGNYVCEGSTSTMETM